MCSCNRFDNQYQEYVAEWIRSGTELQFPEWLQQNHPTFTPQLRVSEAMEYQPVEN